MKKEFAIVTMIIGVFFTFAWAQDSIDGCMQRATDLKNEGRYEEAVGEYGRAIKLDPGNPKVIEAYYKRGCINVDWLQRYDDAVTDCSRAIDADPDNADYYYCRGLAYYRMKSWSQAIKDFNSIIEIDPAYKSGEAHYALGFIYDQLHDYGQAIRSYTKAIEVNPRQPKFYLDRGCSYFEIKNYKAAKKDWLAARGLNPHEQLKQSIAKNLKVLSEQTEDGIMEVQEQEPARPKKMSWAEQQRSETGSPKTDFNDEELNRRIEAWGDAFADLSSKLQNKDFSGARGLFTNGEERARLVRQRIEELSFPSDMGRAFQNITCAIKNWMEASILIVEETQKVQASPEDLNTLKNAYKKLKQGYSLLEETDKYIGEMARLGEAGSQEARDFLAGFGKTDDIRSGVAQTREVFDRAMQALPERINYLEKKLGKKPTVFSKETPPPKEKTYQEKPKSVWELMRGGGKTKKEEPQEYEPPAQPQGSVSSEEEWDF